MVRKPSIHVTQEGLFKVLEEMGFKFPSNGLKRTFLNKLQEYQVKRNLVFAPTTAAAAKVQGKKITDAAAQKSYAILAELRSAGKAMMRMIKPGQPGWPDVLEASQAADLFVQRFDIDDVNAGHRMYYKVAIEILGANFNLKSLATQYEKVCNKFQEDVDLFQCKDLTKVKEMMEQYIKLARLTKQAAVALSSQKIWFVRAYNQATELGVDPLKFIEIQFEQMAWANVNPTPKQLSGEQAFNRLITAKTKLKDFDDSNPKTDKQALYAKLLNK
jgi:hypothetical protein